MFKQHTLLSSETVRIEYDGKEIDVPSGVSVAAAVLGRTHDRHCRNSTISGEKRGPYCLIGVCHECLMEINGRPYQQACLTTVEDGMKIKKQNFSGDKKHA